MRVLDMGIWIGLDWIGLDGVDGSGWVEILIGWVDTCCLCRDDGRHHLTSEHLHEINITHIEYYDLRNAYKDFLFQPLGLDLLSQLPQA
jgi:hypothetical protein